MVRGYSGLCLIPLNPFWDKPFLNVPQLFCFCFVLCVCVYHGWSRSRRSWHSFAILGEKSPPLLGMCVTIDTAWYTTKGQLTVLNCAVQLKTQRNVSFSDTYCRECRWQQLKGVVHPTSLWNTGSVQWPNRIGKCFLSRGLYSSQYFGFQFETRRVSESEILFFYCKCFKKKFEEFVLSQPRQHESRPSFKFIWMSYFFIANKSTMMTMWTWFYTIINTAGYIIFSLPRVQNCKSLTQDL